MRHVATSRIILVMRGDVMAATLGLTCYRRGHKCAKRLLENGPAVFLE